MDEFFYALVRKKLCDDAYGSEWLYLKLEVDEVNEDYDLYRNGDLLNKYFFDFYWNKILELMIAIKVSCEDLRKFQDSQGVYFKEVFWDKLSEALSRS